MVPTLLALLLAVSVAASESTSEVLARIEGEYTACLEVPPTGGKIPKDWVLRNEGSTEYLAVFTPVDRPGPAILVDIGPYVAEVRNGYVTMVGPHGSERPETTRYIRLETLGHPKPGTVYRPVDPHGLKLHVRGLEVALDDEEISWIVGTAFGVSTTGTCHSPASRAKSGAPSPDPDRSSSWVTVR